MPLREKDGENRQTVIIRTAAHNPSKHKQNDVFKIGRMVLDYLVAHDETISVYGICAIFGKTYGIFYALSSRLYYIVLDMEGISLGHALQMTPRLIKRAVNSWEHYPLRIKKLEFVNANYGINVVLDIFRSFMTAKMKERISVKRGNPKFKASDKLPKELGGVVETYATLAHLWKQTLENDQQWFLDDDKFKSLH